MDLATLRTLLDLGWPAIVLLICFFLWRAYQARTDQLIKSLQDEVELFTKDCLEIVHTKSQDSSDK